MAVLCHRFRFQFSSPKNMRPFNHSTCVESTPSKERFIQTIISIQMHTCVRCVCARDIMETIYAYLVLNQLFVCCFSVRTCSLAHFCTWSVCVWVYAYMLTDFCLIVGKFSSCRAFALLALWSIRMRFTTPAVCCSISHISCPLFLSFAFALAFLFLFFFFSSSFFYVECVILSRNCVAAIDDVSNAMRSQSACLCVLCLFALCLNRIEY